MPALPGQVHIKRKFEDEPVEFLHVHNELDANGPRKHVFMRKRLRVLSPDDPIPSTISSIGTQKLDGSAIQPPRPTLGFQSPVTSAPLPHTPSTSQDLAVECTGEIKSQEPRRFYFSRAPQTTSRDGNAPGKALPKVFMEKKPRRIVTAQLDSAQKPSLNIKEPSNAASASIFTQAPSTINPVQPSEAPLRGNRLPSGKIMPWDATATKLASEMQAYTLQHIGDNLAQAAAADAHMAALRKSSLRFKPNPPPPRYRDRHPEVVAEDEAMIEADDDSGYILETYIRVPIEMFDSLDPTKTGLLVLDSQPTIDEFYNDDSDDDSEIFDEEEDENAENHPSTDYPEDEVDSDDEFGRNPYQYRNRNASDEEEFDEDDDDEGGTFSDDDAEAWTPAWAKRP